MTKQELKIKFETAVKNDDKKTLAELLNPVIEKLSVMINKGILIKNVKRHLENNGITGKACEMLTEMAIIRAENFQFNKAK